MDAETKHRLDAVIISPQLSLSEALVRLDQAGTGALVLCDEERKLVGLLTDGDIRRAVMQGSLLTTQCVEVANRQPILGKVGLSMHDALQVMMQSDIEHLPVVDADGVIQDFLLQKHLAAERPLVGGAALLFGIIIHPNRTIADAIAQLDRAGTGALVICSQGHQLEGLLSDGDIRRAIMHGISLDAPCGSIARHDPFTARHPLVNAEALRLMLERDVNQLPVVDAEGNLIDFLIRRDLAQETLSNLSAVIMAGGFGKRLMPLTEQTPKPMLPVGEKPLLERTIERLHKAGVHDVHLTTHYLPESIRQHFGDGEKFGVHVSYAHEDYPMGTAGGLRLLARPSNPFIVINGDILTGVSFESMLNFHLQHQAQLTVGVRKYEVKVPFGVVECEDVHIRSLQEKPLLDFFVNAGIYLLEPTAYDLIPEGKYFNMTDLIQKLLDLDQPVVSFPIMEYWLDVGQSTDYRQAQEDARNGKI